MNKQIKWASGVLVFIGLITVIANAAVRLNKLEEQGGKVPQVEKAVKIITLYIKLVDPDNYKRAEELAK